VSIVTCYSAYGLKQLGGVADVATLLWWDFRIPLPQGMHILLVLPLFLRPCDQRGLHTRHSVNCGGKTSTGLLYPGLDIRLCEWLYGIHIEKQALLRGSKKVRDELALYD